VNSNLERDKYVDEAIKEIHKWIDKRAGETKDLKQETRAATAGSNRMIVMLEERLDTLEEDESIFQTQLDSLAEKACHCVDRIVPVQKREPDVVFFNPPPDLLSSEGTNHSSRAPSELEYVTPPLGTDIPLRPISVTEMVEVAPASEACACSASWSSDQENERPVSPLIEVPRVALDPIDSTIVMRQDQVVRRVEALETKLRTHVSHSGRKTYQGRRSTGIALKHRYAPYLQVERNLRRNRRRAERDLGGYESSSESGSSGLDGPSSSAVARSCREPATIDLVVFGGCLQGSSVEESGRAGGSSGSGRGVDELDLGGIDPVVL